MIEKPLNEIYTLVQKENAKEDISAVPHSDDFSKQVQSLLGISQADLKMYINILKESHKLFVFEIVKEDPDHDIKKIEGYVDADLKTISRLKSYYQNKLMEEYEKKYRKRLLVHQIVKEIFPQIKLLNNTTLGFIANKAIMLEEYENLIEKEYFEYSDSWKDDKLNDLIEEYNKISSKNKEAENKDDAVTAGKISSIPSNRRAIDTEEYQEFQSKNTKESIRKMLKVYGVDFFYRVHLRKYDFDIIINAVEMREIDRKPDLKILKEHLKKIKMNYNRDPELEKYADQIYKLERLISRNIVTAHS
ncbi:MAG TPA: hypothetical protein PK926_06970 [Spirochaetota bacterium]|nr:hypothetical protein [Spirochaetota bacterium]HPI90880.1 hypothetical protein [Spirochaetota bacterium]HPR48110.1 hypothetical protein [Spirochaetota bacterium]